MGEADSIVYNFAVGSRDKFPPQVIVAASDGILGEFVDHVLRRLEQDAAIGGTKHRGVVIGVPRRNDMKVQLLERFDRASFTILQAELVAADVAVGLHEQAMTEQAGELELAHQGMGELVEGIREYDYLCATFQPEKEILRARQGSHAVDDLLNLWQGDSVLVQNVEPILHQLVVIRFFSGGAGQCFDAGSLGNIDPDFRYKNPFEVKTCDHG